jgi:2-polyprenyl-6-methoxyphenol hydroxylase-like FAD-dependent oxidoreductase
VAIGDAWITNDPLAAQGANLGSHCAWVAAEAIARARTFDARLGAEIESAMWDFAGPVTAFSNALLEPPARHVLKLMSAAAGDRVVADAFASAFADPVHAGGLFADPAAVDRLIETAGSGTPWPTVPPRGGIHHEQ